MEVHSYSPVNAVSILPTPVGRLPPPQKIAPAATSAMPIGESAFASQLNTAIEEWQGQAKDSKPDTATPDSKGNTAKKKSAIPQLPLVVIPPQPVPPAPPPAAFGIPSAG